MIYCDWKGSMIITEIDEIKERGKVGKNFNTDQPINVDSIIEILKKYESDTIKLFDCTCETFTESGNPVNRVYTDIRSLSDLYDFDSPSIQVTAVYIDSKTGDYKFTVSMAANTRGIGVYHSEKGEAYVKWRLELERMELEAQKIEKKINEEGYTK